MRKLAALFFCCSALAAAGQADILPGLGILYNIQPPTPGNTYGAPTVWGINVSGNDTNYGEAGFGNSLYLGGTYESAFGFSILLSGQNTIAVGTGLADAGFPNVTLIGSSLTATKTSQILFGNGGLATEEVLVGGGTNHAAFLAATNLTNATLVFADVNGVLQKTNGFTGNVSGNAAGLTNLQANALVNTSAVSTNGFTATAGTNIYFLRGTNQAVAVTNLPAGSILTFIVASYTGSAYLTNLNSVFSFPGLGTFTNSVSLGALGSSSNTLTVVVSPSGTNFNAWP